MNFDQPVSRARFVWLSTGIVLAGVAIRAIALMRMPFQWLEAFNLTQAHLAASGRVLASSVELKKWLSPPFLALFEPVGPEGPFIARMLSVLLAALSIAACINLGRVLANRRVSLVAGALYALLPLAVFHERQGLADVLLAALTTLALVFSVWLARRPNIGSALLLGAALAGAYLTKVAALPYAALPFWAILLLAPRRQWLRAGLFAGLALVIAVALTAIPYGLYVERNPQEYASVPHAMFSQIANLTRTGGSEDYAAHIRRQLVDFSDVLATYLGWPFLALTAIGGVMGMRSKHWRALLFLSVPAILFIAPSILSQSAGVDARDPFFAARYILQNMVPLIVLGALAVHTISQNRRLATRQPAAWVIAGITALLVLGPWLWFDLSLWGDPAHVRLTAIDRMQYVEGQAAGYGFQDGVDRMLAVRRETGKPVHVLATGDHLILQALLGQRDNSARMLSQTEPETAARWLGRGDTVFIFESGTQQPLPIEQPLGAHLTLLEEYENAWGVQRLYQVTGAEGELAAMVYSARTPEPDKLTEDYAGIAGTLNPDASARLVFPGAHAAPLQAASGLEMIPLDLAVWPAEASTFVAALDAVPVEENQLVEAILIDEAHADPERGLLLALLDRWYRVDESWAGYAHRIGYWVAPDSPTLPSINAAYEGQIQLVSGGTLTDNAAPDQIIAIVLTWQAAQPIQDSFKVFVHVTGSDGTIRAQYDAEPGWGLRPMPSWEPGEPFTDRFALRLPADIPPDVYEIRVGIYHPASGLRLPVIEAAEHGGDYVVIGRINVR